MPQDTLQQPEKATNRAENRQGPPHEQTRVKGGETERVMRLYDSRAALYDLFVSAARYPQGLEAAFRASERLREKMRILDAGCGSGISTFALLRALRSRALVHECVHAFDLNATMLHRFSRRLEAARLQNVSVRQANVMNLGELPDNWGNYDLIISAGMLEYVDRQDFTNALSQLQRLLAPGGWLMLFISRKSWTAKWLIERWWRANAYTSRELHAALVAAGFENVTAKAFPRSHQWLNVWGHVVEAKRGDSDRSRREQDGG